MAAQYIRIVAIPPGEAPLWVREKWVGLCLPVADSQGPREAYVSGVLSRPLGKLPRQSGYAVYVRDAISELEKTAPDAAAWWRKDAPGLDAARRKFLFRTPCCELVQRGCEASHQDVSRIQPDRATTPLAGLSPVPQTPMHRTAARMILHRSPLVPALLLALVLFGGLWNSTHPIHPEQQAVVHGNLVDWNLHTHVSKSRTYRTVHLRITGQGTEFRIDPDIFRDLMGGRLPAGFAKGATIDITADAAQLAAPIHPLLRPGVGIVWINGLVVNGVTAFTLRDVVQQERHRWTGWLALAGLAALYLGYTIRNSRKQSASA